MKVELHCHTNRYSACAQTSPEETVEALVEREYQAVYFTEHDAVWPENEIRDINDAYPEIRIFPGLEITLEHGDFQHLIVLGTSNPKYLELAGKPAALIAKARSEGLLTVLAHPFRTEGGHAILDENIEPDAMEFWTCNQKHGLSALAREEAAERGLPLINAGDVHSTSCMDLFWLETATPIIAATDIRGLVLGRAYTLNMCLPGRIT